MSYFKINTNHCFEIKFYTSEYHSIPIKIIRKSLVFRLVEKNNYLVL